jgi:hypothetical protein
MSGWLLGMPFMALDSAMRDGGQGNPVAIALVDAGAAAAATASGVAMALIAVSVYRRLAR